MKLKPATRRDVLLAGLGGLLSVRPALAQSRLPIVATFSILADFTKRVGGERIAVTALVGPDGDVHVYEPTPGDARLLAATKAVVVNGLGLEGWIDRLIAVSGSTAARIVASHGVTARNMAAARNANHLVPDPHAWQSVDNAKIYVANIRDGLSDADPAGKDIYSADAASYLTKLDALDQEVRAAIAKIPPERRKIITTHDAFGYFGADYGMEFIAPEGVSTDVEPSAADVGRIMAQIRRQRIPAVFLENVTDPRLMRQIAEETGAAIGGTLYSDALSPPGGPAATYIDMMRSNVRELVKALS